MVSTIRLRRTACVPLPSCQRRNPEAPFFRGLHRLAVNDGRAGGGLPSCGFPNPNPQGFLHPFPRPVIPPLPKVPPHRAPRRQIMGQSASADQGMPPRNTYSTPLTTSRRAGAGDGPERCRAATREPIPPTGRRFRLWRTGIRFPTHAVSVTSIPLSSQEPAAQVWPIVTHPLNSARR